MRLIQTTGIGFARGHPSPHVEFARGEFREGVDLIFVEPLEFLEKSYIAVR